MNLEIPCRAKDPNTCPYHGAEIRIQAALDKNDWNAFETAREEQFAARNIDEVREFFNSYEPEPAADAYKTHDEILATLSEIDRAKFEAAQNSFSKRLDDFEFRVPMQKTIVPSFPVGGYPGYTVQPKTPNRAVYQQVANMISDTDMIPVNTGANESGYYVNHDQLFKKIDDAHGEVKDRDMVTANALRKTKARLENIVQPGITDPVTKHTTPRHLYADQALEVLDYLYWAEA